MVGETLRLSLVVGERLFSTTPDTSGAVLAMVLGVEVEVVELPSKSIATATQVRSSPTLASVEETVHVGPVAAAICHRVLHGPQTCVHASQAIAT